MKKLKWRPEDNLTDGGAKELAARIMAYWMSRGLDCNARVERVWLGRESIWVVRSDMENGLPTGANANVDF